MLTTFRLIRSKELTQLVGLSRSQVYRLERAGKFPRRRQLGPNSVAWVLSEVLAWCETRAPAHLGGDAPDAREVPA